MLFLKYVIVFSLILTTCVSEECVDNPNDDNIVVIKKNENMFTVAAPKNEKCLSFYAKHDDNFHVILGSYENGTKSEISLVYMNLLGEYYGVFDNRIMKDLTPLTPMLSYVNTNEFRGFWMTWYNNNLKVGKQGVETAFLDCRFEEFDIDFIGFRRITGGDLNIKMTNCYHCPGIKVDAKKVESNVSAPKGNEQEKSDPENYLNRLLRAQKDLSKQLDLSYHHFNTSSDMLSDHYLKLQMENIKKIYTEAEQNQTELLEQTLLSKLDNKNYDEATAIFHKIKYDYLNFFKKLSYEVKQSKTEDESSYY